MWILFSICWCSCESARVINSHSCPWRERRHPEKEDIHIPHSITMAVVKQPDLCIKTFFMSSARRDTSLWRRFRMEFQTVPMETCCVGKLVQAVVSKSRQEVESACSSNGTTAEPSRSIEGIMGDTQGNSQERPPEFNGLSFHECIYSG